MILLSTCDIAWICHLANNTNIARVLHPSHDSAAISALDQGKHCKQTQLLYSFIIQHGITLTQNTKSNPVCKYSNSSHSVNGANMIMQDHSFCPKVAGDEKTVRKFTWKILIKQFCTASNSCKIFAVECAHMPQSSSSSSEAKTPCSSLESWLSLRG